METNYLALVVLDIELLLALLVLYPSPAGKNDNFPLGGAPLVLKRRHSQEIE